MRVLSVGNIYPPHDFAGGYELTWRASVRHLRGRGHEVRVLASEYRAPGLAPATELDADVHRELRWYWRDHSFPSRGLRERLSIERANGAVLAHHLDDMRPDAIAWWGMGGMSLGLIERARRRGVPAVGVVGDEWMVWGPRADRWLAPLRNRPRLASVAERATGVPASVELGRAATWLFNSALVQERSAEAAGPLASGRVVHPGADLELFQPAEARPWRWRMAYVGRLDERKGVHLAIDALSQLPAEATLWIAGTGDAAYEDALRLRASAGGVADRVEFTVRPRSELPRLYADADAVVFPVQWDEPWGLVPLEAMAVGRPVVASGTGGSREYLRDGENCLLYEPLDSADALAAAVRRLADDEELRRRIREGGLQTVPRYTQAAYNEAIERALHEVTGR
jgi:glycosyltransferase involved in cell wall biosynthesis